MLRLTLLAGAAVAGALAMTAPAAAQTAATTSQAAGGVTTGAWGFDLAGRDPSVNPGDDFFRHANGGYLDKLEIPADRSTGGVWIGVIDQAEANTRRIIDDALAGRLQDEDAARIAAAYASFMDEARIELLDAAPVKTDLDRVRAVDSRAGLARLMGESAGGFGGASFGLLVEGDLKAPTANTLYIGQGGITLPDRDYYLKPSFAEQKTKYQAYVAQMLGLAGWPNAEKTAADILAMETRIAEVSWPAEDRRDLGKIYNPVSLAELQRTAPGFPWAEFVAGAGVGGRAVYVLNENTAVPKIATVFAETPLDTLKAWHAFTVVDQAAPYLSKRFVDARFEFRNKVLNGQQQQRPRWKRAVVYVNASLGEAVGRVYVARHFPPGSKAKMDKLVSDLIVATGKRIDGLDWMSAATKVEARKKLANLQPMIGYPPKFRSFQALRQDPADLYGNVKRSAGFEWAFQVDQLNKPMDKDQWGLLPHEVNAQYHPIRNYIIFPAGILQPPFFNPDADPAINYGAIGGVIGHEIIHGFDDSGRKTDSTGALRDWWTAEDGAKFDARAKRLGEQYDAFEALPGMHVNGKLTMGENIGDLGGLTIALDAYRVSLNGKPAPVIDGLTGDQRVFLGWAQVWREKRRDALLKQLLVSDPHAPSIARTNGVVRNIDAWYAAFDIKPGDKLYIAPQDRVRIW